MSFSDSTVVGQATRDGQNVDAGAQGAIRTAIDALTPHDSDARVEALINKLQAILEPVAGATGLTKADRLAEQLAAADRLVAAAGPLDLEARAEVSKVMKSAQAQYLAEVSPGAAVAVERETAYEAIRKGAAA